MIAFIFDDFLNSFIYNDVSFVPTIVRCLQLQIQLLRLVAGWRS